jgi:ankyrin repeat protein
VVDDDVSAGGNDAATSRLISCSRQGRVDLVRLTLRHPHHHHVGSVDVNARNINGNTSLIYASEGGHIDVVRVLLNHDMVDVNASGEKGRTALIGASNFGRFHVVRELLNHNSVDMNERHECGKIPFFGALSKRNVEKVDVNSRDHDGLTALMHASLYGHVEVVRELLNCDDIDVNARDNKGYTSLMCALGGSKIDVPRELLNHNHDNVDTNVYTYAIEVHLEGWTAYIHSIHTDVVREFLNCDEVDMKCEG